MPSPSRRARAPRARSRSCALAVSLLVGGCALAGAPAGGHGSSPDGGAANRASGDADEARGFAPWHADFASYREGARRHLLARALPGRTPAEIELNLPFERVASPHVPYRGRFLLFHGLNDSPAVWHDFADELVARGFDVRAILFAAHGSTPEDMLDVSWTEWLDAGRAWLADWLPTTDGPSDPVPVHLGGFSMGGVIATRLALEEPTVAGLLLVSPAYRSSLDRYLRFAGLYARLRPWVFGGMILEDNPIKYNSIPVNSGWQFHRLTRSLARRWRPADRIDVPALLVLSAEDSVVDVGYTRRLFRRRFTNERRLLITYAPGGAGEEPGPPHEETRDSRRPEHRILGQSHLSLTNAPDNPLFGRAGRVLVCNGNEYPVFMACMRATRHWYGAQHTPSPDGVPVARVTWNPDWEHVLERFDEVFAIERAEPASRARPDGAASSAEEGASIRAIDTSRGGARAPIGTGVAWKDEGRRDLTPAR